MEVLFGLDGTPEDVSATALESNANTAPEARAPTSSTTASPRRDSLSDY